MISKKIVPFVSILIIAMFFQNCADSASNKYKSNPNDQLFEDLSSIDDDNSGDEQTTEENQITWTKFCNYSGSGGAEWEEEISLIQNDTNEIELNYFFSNSKVTPSQTSGRHTVDFDALENNKCRFKKLGLYDFNDNDGSVIIYVGVCKVSGKVEIWHKGQNPNTEDFNSGQKHCTLTL